MRYDDEEYWKARASYEPGVDDPCVDLDCTFNSFTGCTRGECVHFDKAAHQKKTKEARVQQLTAKLQNAFLKRTS